MLPGLVVSKLFVQGFIGRRSRLRWAAHQLIFWGCVLAAAVTFPLTFGWLHFESVGQVAREYRLVIADLGTPVTFDARGVFGWFMFHALDVSAVLVLAGVFLFLGRRLRDAGALAVERAGDFLPLAGLFAVSVTGLMLTASNLWLGGPLLHLHHDHARPDGHPRADVHPVRQAVPHLPAPRQPRRRLLQARGRRGRQAHCSECGRPWASRMQVDDLQQVLPAVGFDYSIASERGGGNWQEVCPPCRRRLVALAQSQRVGGFG